MARDVAGGEQGTGAVSTPAPLPGPEPAPRVIAGIQARMGSTRLPGKVMMDIGGVPLLTRLLRRLRRAERLDGIVLATTTNPADDVLAGWAADEDVPCYRGSEDDVLARIVGAQRMMGADIVVHVCGDTPLADPAVIDAAVDAFLDRDCDIVSNTCEFTYPQGVDAHVFRLSDLMALERSVADPPAREHVSLYFHEHPERYRMHRLRAPAALRDPRQRLQVDYPEDLALVREIYARLEPLHGDAFGTAEVVDLLRTHPALREINRHCQEKPVR